MTRATIDADVPARSSRPTIDEDTRLADFFRKVEQSLGDHPLRTKAYPARAGTARARNPLASYMRSIRAMDRRYSV